VLGQPFKKRSATVMVRLSTDQIGNDEIGIEVKLRR
jgi:hypothetical protein